MTQKENCFNESHYESMAYQLRTRKAAHEKGIGGESFIRRSLISTAKKNGAPLVKEAEAWNEKMIQIYGTAIIV